MDNKMGNTRRVFNLKNIYTYFEEKENVKIS